MHPVDCPRWEYADSPGAKNELALQTKRILADLRNRVSNSQAVACDTRPSHNQMFGKLAPADCNYYAGHYRGESFRCLKHHSVGIPSDPTVGAHPNIVTGRMSSLRDLIMASLAGLDAGNAMPNSVLDAKKKLSFTICIICRIFICFNVIHPYVNGNGHAARLCLIALLGRYNIWLRDWSIDPRPADPPYVWLIVEYRKGNTEPLEKYILSLISPN
jgi:fido (protein-threonine AMPylation protein)